MRTVQPAIAAVTLAISSATVLLLAFYLSHLLDSLIVDGVTFSCLCLPALLAGKTTASQPLSVVAAANLGLFFMALLGLWAFNERMPWGFAGFLIPGFMALFVIQSIVCLAAFRLRGKKRRGQSPSK